MPFSSVCSCLHGGEEEKWTKWRGACRGLQESCGSKCGPLDEPSELCVCVCVCVCPRHSCRIMGCTELLAKDVAVLAGASASGFMDGVGCVKWCGYHSILAQVSWDTQMLRLRCACMG